MVMAVVVVGVDQQGYIIREDEMVVGDAMHLDRHVKTSIFQFPSPKCLQIPRFVLTINYTKSSTSLHT
ncbi:hypothetical protein L6452_18742 [Arctium lappa]|uniref:Uncharacterized protein n=1 Tax=Arctium lappa TaxID=4217 RepID=A0ACB9C6X2_ARCLA|nr:hypothetical protein L6452_18742 [Arctium lappa]